MVVGHRQLSTTTHKAACSILSTNSRDDTRVSSRDHPHNPSCVGGCTTIIGTLADAIPQLGYAPVKYVLNLVHASKRFSRVHSSMNCRPPPCMTCCYFPLARASIRSSSERSDVRLACKESRLPVGTTSFPLLETLVSGTVMMLGSGI